MKKLFTLVLITISIITQGQVRYSPSLIRAVSEAKQGEKLTFYVQGDHQSILEEVKAMGGRYNHTFRNHLSVTIPMDKIESFCGKSFVTSIEYEYHKPVLLNDDNLVNNNVIKVHDGEAPLLSKYTGKDVVIGIIDTGVDFTHPDFQDSLGKTRVLHIWDHTIDSASVTKFPSNFSYGQEWDSTDINTGVCTHTDGATHGTNVTGMAAANGLATGNYKGSAPEADIIMVATNFSGFNWLSEVADAIEYIFDKADSLGKPCVINISAGTFAGAHDGRDPNAQRIDSLMKAKEGRAIVCAAGNSGNSAPFHLGYDITSDTVFTWYDFNSAASFAPYAPSGSVFMEFYSEPGGFNNIWFSFGVDQNSPTYSKLGETQYLNSLTHLGSGFYQDSILNANGDRLATVYIFYGSIYFGATNIMQVVIDPDSTGNYNWRFSTTGSGRIDGWGNSSIYGISNMITTVPDSSDFPDIANYQQPDSLQSIVSSFTCLPDVITVGNYVNKNRFTDVTGTVQTLFNEPQGKLYSGSSKGPSRTGHVKPTVAAPGSTTIVAAPLAQMATWVITNPEVVAPDSLHRTANGTSMASPSVAGIVALLFEKCHKFNYADIMDAIVGGARKDNFTGVTPNPKYGYGKADAYNSFLQPTEIVTLNLSDTVEVCRDTLLETTTFYPQYFWSSGSNDPDILAIPGDSYSTVVLDSDGCPHFSDTVYVKLNPFLIPSPQLNVGDTTLCESDNLTIGVVNNYNTYDWINTSSSSTYPDASTISTNETGGYYVLVTDIYECQAYSDTAQLTFLISPPKPTVTLLNDSILESSAANNYQWFRDSIVLVGDTLSSYTARDTGNYYVQVSNANGCVANSDTVYLEISQPVGVEGLFKRTMNVFPNPFEENLFVEFSDQDTQEIKITNILGEDVESAVNITHKSPTMVELDFSKIPSGIYFLYFHDESNVIKKVIKK